MNHLIAIAGIALLFASLAHISVAQVTDTKIHYRTAKVRGLEIFYREAGLKDSPAVLLLHGFPSSSHMFRNLIPALSQHYRVVAPDLPGFGFSSAPDRTKFNYTFDNLTNIIDEFTKQINLTRYAIYVFDYGAPVGFRLAMNNPEKIIAIISQNGNAYEEGLSNGWAPIREYWNEPTEENRNALKDLLTIETTKWQYTHGVPDVSLIAPESYLFDQLLLDRSDNVEIQLDLFGDYKSNVAMYGAFQEYFRMKSPPFLALWGKNDPYFLPSGAEAFRKDIPTAEIKFYETGHFALETHALEIGSDMISFLSKIMEK